MGSAYIPEIRGDLELAVRMNHRTERIVEQTRVVVRTNGRILNNNSPTQPEKRQISNSKKKTQRTNK